MRMNSVDEMITLHRALRYLKILGGDKGNETLNDMLSRLDKWHRIYNQKRYSSILAFSDK